MHGVRGFDKRGTDRGTVVTSVTTPWPAVWKRVGAGLSSESLETLMAVVPTRSMQPR